MEKTTMPRQRLLQTFARYHVRYLQEITSFDILEEAYAFFKNLNVPAALWDVSETPYVVVTKDELIEA